MRKINGFPIDINKRELLGVITLILISALGRILLVKYHLQPFPNFEVITLVTFLGIYLFRSKLIFIIPVLGMIISDAVLGNYMLNNPLNKIIIFTYSGFIFLVLISRFSIRKWSDSLTSINLQGITVVTGIAVILTLIYDIWTNFGWWYLFYPHTLEALIGVFIAGIPFMLYHMLSNVFFLLAVALPFIVYTATTKTTILKTITTKQLSSQYSR